MHDKHDLNFCIIQLSAVWHSTQGLMPSLLYALAYTKCFVSFSMPCPTHLPRLLVHPHPPTTAQTRPETRPTVPDTPPTPWIHRLAVLRVRPHWRAMVLPRPLCSRAL